MPEDLSDPDPFSRHAAEAVGKGGFVRHLTHHTLSYTPGQGQRLVVTFDNLASLGQAERMPWGHAFLTAQGWDVLGVMARRKDWFRCPETIAALEALRDDGFFARFPAVSMYGASMGGYGAIAFAPLAPGCTVLAFAPQSSLDKRHAPFENRYRWGAKQGDWDAPYADAADSVAAASRIYLLYDPRMSQDNAHAVRLSGPNVTELRLPHAGHKIPFALQKMKLLKRVSISALKGDLSAVEFARLYRERRASIVWTLALLERALDRGHLTLGLRASEFALALRNKRQLRRMRKMFVRAIRMKAKQQKGPETGAL
jgi:hypothetical protein